MIELKQRTPGEKAAYLAGYDAGMRAAVDALVKISAVTEQATRNLQTEIAVLLALSAKDSE